MLVVYVGWFGYIKIYGMMDNLIWYSVNDCVFEFLFKDGKGIEVVMILFEGQNGFYKGDLIIVVDGYVVVYVVDLVIFVNVYMQN